MNKNEQTLQEQLEALQKEVEALKQEIEQLAKKAYMTINSIVEINSTDSLRKNIQRGKLIAYDYVISLIEKIKIK